MIDIPPSLVARVRQKDEAAFEEMLSIAYVPLLRVSQAFLRSPDDAKDVVQDVLVKVWLLGDSWNPTGSPIAYLLASVRNQALKVRKTLERFQYSHGEDIHDEGGDANTLLEEIDPLQALIESETESLQALQVERAIHELNDRYRTVYILRYRSGLSIAQIADMLDISYKAAEHLVRRATADVLRALKK